ncbi:MAG: hypothetical protein SVV03_04355 [Candidatus Nanohaloarchaea archaeon]|nr:hypothetical protein [Candidatus Nanohaloarchaea archaeon]
MVGMVVIAGMIAGILVYSMGGIGDTGFGNSKFLFERKVEEFPRAVSIISDESGRNAEFRANLRSYMEYVGFVERQHLASSEGFVLAGVPVKEGYNVSFGNFLGRTVEDVRITAGGDSSTLASVGNRRIEAVHLDPSGDRFTVDVDFSGFRENFTTSRKVFSFIRTNTTTESNLWSEKKAN